VRPLTKLKKDIEFNQVLLDSIDEALTSLGEKAKASMYFYLQSNFGLPKKNIPDRVNEFADALEKIFGQGALQLETLIMKCLNEKVGGEYKWSGPKWLVPDLTFTKYVKLMRLFCEESENAADIEVLLDADEEEQEA
jgi:hypothetical protein